MLSARNVINHQILFDGIRYITDEDFAAEDARTRIKAGDVLLTIVGTIGRTAVVPKQAESFALQRSVAVLKPIEIDGRYLAYVLDEPSQQQWLTDNAKGTAQKGVYLKTLGTAKIPVAPIAEQTRIVEKLEELLSELDAGVAELKAAQRKLAQYRQSLLKAAVEGALTADWRAARQQNPQTPSTSSRRRPGSSAVAATGSQSLDPGLRRGDGESETGAQLLQRILTERRARWEANQLAKFADKGKTPPKGWQAKYKDPAAPDTNDLPALPEGWTWATVDQLSFVVRGASPRPAGDPRYFGGDILWITVGSLTADEGMYLDSVDQFVTRIGKDASRYIEPDTLLLTNSGATLGVPKITRIGGCINDGSVALLEVDKPVKIYLYWFLRTQTKRFRGLNQGAAQPNLNTSIVRRICVPICCSKEMARVNASLEKAVDAVRLQEGSIEYGIAQSTAQRKNILKAAFAGHLVPQDPNDEPASVLLERIRAERDNTNTSSSRVRRTKQTKKALEPNA